MRLLMDVGSCLKILSGWLECLWVYNGTSLYFLVVKSKVISKKFTSCKFASAVTFWPNCLKAL